MPALPLTPDEVPALLGKDGERLCYLDSAATSLKPRAVVDRISQFYLHENAPVHRGVYDLSSRATDLYEEARKTVAAFVGADPEWLVFTRGSTEAMNLVARAWGEGNLSPGDEILISPQEHHSNLLPWQELAARTGATLLHIPLHDDGTLDLEAGLALIGHNTRLLALAHVSNVLGVENPVIELTTAAKEAGALTMIDGAQSVPTRPVDIHVLGCDFLAFSGHKMLGPTGIGALVARPELLEEMAPYQTGGGMIQRAATDSADYLQGYARFEAGTPHAAGAIGLAAACDFLDALSYQGHEGMEAVAEYEMDWGKRAVEQIREIDGLRLIGPPPGQEPEGGIVAVQIEGLHPHDLALLLDAQGVMVRAGHHCAMPLHDFLSEDGAFPETSLRASAYVYNTLEDADRFAAALRFAHEALTKRQRVKA